MTSAIDPRSDDWMLEIGPGQGALTDFLAGSVERYVVVELDRDLTPWLAARYPQIEVIQADILRCDFADLLPPGRTWKVVGNLPYNISSPLILMLAEFVRHEPARISAMHFMLQKEMAARLAAVPGTKAWGRLSIMVQLSLRTELLFDVMPESFSPPPKVTSSVLRMQPALQYPDCDVEALRRVLGLAFSSRRKRMANALKTLQLDWSSVALDPDVRADNVTLDEFINLAHIVAESEQENSA
jgi:16S rRNA (adenine1518-N6/adenine1519-N6)-dimethyltransferase